jgi:hypothetical protein
MVSTSGFSPCDAVNTCPQQKGSKRGKKSCASARNVARQFYSSSDAEKLLLKTLNLFEPTLY